MKITEAERIIRGGAERYRELEETKAAIRLELHKSGANHHAQRARLYYELVRSTLAEEHSSENGELLHEFTAFRRELDKETEAFEAKLREPMDHETTQRIRNAYASFCRTSERSMTNLEVLFRRHSFHEREQETYLAKMRYRMREYRLQRKYVTLAVYKILDTTSRFGTSFHRWGLTTLGTILSFGALMMIADTHQTGNSMIALGEWYDYFYFSVIAFTTAGFGDILPSTALLKLIVAVEVLLGYVMLGILITLIQRKMR